ncbi:5' nucleotidase, NT5C type [Nitrospira sp. Nam74]
MDRPAFGIDIDGVLSDVDVMLDELAIQYTGKPWPREFAAAPSSTTELIPDHLLQQIFDEFHETRIPLLSILPGAREALELLQTRYRLVLVTARRATSETLTREWLFEHGIPFDALYHLENKCEVPEALSLAIDDHPRHIARYLEQGIRCFVMDYPRNRQLMPHPQLTRVQSWPQVIEQLPV